MSLEDRIEQSIRNVLDQLDEEQDAEDAVRWADAAFKLCDALDTAFPSADGSEAALDRIEAVVAQARSPSD